MFDPQKLLDQFLGGRSEDGTRKGMSPDMMKGLAGGAAAGGLAAILLGTKGGRKLTGTAIKLGGTAMLASLAYRAWQNWQASKGAQSTVPPQPTNEATPKAEGTAFLPDAKPARDAMSLAVMRAMIAAAKADGHIDAGEQQRIFGKLDELNLDTEAKAFVMDELRKPLDIDAVVAAATSPEMATQIYAASLLAIDPDDRAEQTYLSTLASRLKLDAGLKLSIEQETQKASG